MGNNLTTEDLKKVAKHTNFSFEEIEEKYKDFIAKYPSGKVNRDQFQNIYCQFFAPAWGRKGIEKGDSWWRHVFRACDKDGSGSVDFKELILAIDCAAYGTPEQKLEWMFRIYDINRCGSVNERELTAVVTALHEQEINQFRGRKRVQSEKEVVKKCHRLFEKLDKNGDQKVDMQEFIQLCMADDELYHFLVNYQLGGADEKEKSPQPESAQ